MFYDLGTNLNISIFSAYNLLQTWTKVTVPHIRALFLIIFYIYLNISFIWMCY